MKKIALLGSLVFILTGCLEEKKEGSISGAKVEQNKEVVYSFQHYLDNPKEAELMHEKCINGFKSENCESAGKAHSRHYFFGTESAEESLNQLKSEMRNDADSLKSKREERVARRLAEIEAKKAEKKANKEESLNK